MPLVGPPNVTPGGVCQFRHPGQLFLFLTSVSILGTSFMILPYHFAGCLAALCLTTWVKLILMIVMEAADRSPPIAALTVTAQLGGRPQRGHDYPFRRPT